MLSANTTFAILTDYVTMYIMVRSRKSGTLFISSCIKHDATSPSLVCIIVALFVLAYHEYKERTLSSNEPSDSGNKPPTSSQKVGGRGRGREGDDEADENPTPEV